METAHVLLLLAIGFVLFVIIGTRLIGRMLDQKIGDIQVRMPNVRFPQPNIVVKLEKQECKGTEKERPAAKPELGDPRAIQLHEPFLAVRFDDARQPQVDDVTASKNHWSDEPIVVDAREPATTARVVVGCRTDADCNVVHGDGKNVCKADGTCSCVGGGSGLFCHYGPVNYRDPRDMTPQERARFKARFRSDFTLQDYKNWLLLYRSDPENLRQHHRANLRTLLKGGQLSPKDVPKVRIRPPTDAAEYFQKMYSGMNIAVQFPDGDSPYTGANYNEYDEFVPPENMPSTWITGIVDAYKDQGKDDAKALDWYVRPNVTVGEDEERVGRIYQRYTERAHTLADLKKLKDRGIDVGVPKREGLLTF